MKLSRYFTLEEFTDSQEAARRGISNAPDAAIAANLERLALAMDRVRELLGHPVFVSSGYRSPPLNKAIGGSKTSSHMQGLACDFACPGFGNPLEVAQAIAKSGIEFDQLIHEYGRWVHFGLAQNNAPVRGELLTATRGGYRAGLRAA